MTTSHLVAHLRTLWRTERLVAELRMKRLLANLGLQAFAALIAACALLLFELAAYFALVQRWDAIVSAVALGIVDLVLAGLIGMLAVRRPVTRELSLAHDIHHQAVAAFEADLQDLDSHASIRAAIESAVIPALVPLIPLIIERVHKRLAETAANEAAQARKSITEKHDEAITAETHTSSASSNRIRRSDGRDHSVYCDTVRLG